MTLVLLGPFAIVEIVGQRFSNTTRVILSIPASHFISHNIYPSCPQALTYWFHRIATSIPDQHLPKSAYGFSPGVQAGYGESRETASYQTKLQGRYPLR